MNFLGSYFVFFFSLPGWLSPAGNGSWPVPACYPAAWTWASRSHARPLRTSEEASEKKIKDESLHSRDSALFACQDLIRRGFHTVYSHKVQINLPSASRPFSLECYKNRCVWSVILGFLHRTNRSSRIALVFFFGQRLERLPSCSL